MQHPEQAWEIIAGLTMNLLNDVTYVKMKCEMSVACGQVHTKRIMVRVLRAKHDTPCGYHENQTKKSAKPPIPRKRHLRPSLIAQADSQGTFVKNARPEHLQIKE